MPVVAITRQVSPKLRFLSSFGSITGSSWLSSHTTSASSETTEIVAVETISPLVNQPSRSPRSIVISRSEEHTSELQSLMRTSYAVFCLKKQNTQTTMTNNNIINYTNN